MNIFDIIPSLKELNPSVILSKICGDTYQISIYEQDPKNYNEPFKNGSDFKENEYVISLIQLEPRGNVFLIDKIVKMKKFIKNENHSLNEFEYELYEFDGCDNIYGKTTIICNDNINAQCKKRTKKSIEFLEKTEVSDVYSGAIFNGRYTSLKRIPWKTLNAWINDKSHNKSMRDALKKIKAVYLIIDTLTGKKYVGSATGNEGLYQRWTDYVNGDCNGGNVEFTKLSKEYIQENFIYSVLHEYDLKTDNSIIIAAECDYKEILETRNNGYNKN